MANILRVCCLIEDNKKCKEPATQSQFTKKVQKALSGKGFDLIQSPQSDHLYVCKKHSSRIEQLVGATPAAPASTATTASVTNTGSLPTSLPTSSPAQPLLGHLPPPGGPFPGFLPMATSAASSVVTTASLPTSMPAASSVNPANGGSSSSSAASAAAAAAAAANSMAGLRSEGKRKPKRPMAAPEPEVNFGLLHMNTLKRYKRHYKLAEETANKQELIDVVSNHFRQQNVGEMETIQLFSYTIKHRMSKLDKMES